MMRSSASYYSRVAVVGLGWGLAGVLGGCAGTATVPRTAVINGEAAPAPAVRMGNPGTVARILDEGKNRNRVMNHLTHLSVNGPRLTGSTRLEAMNIWTAEQFRSWGLTGVELHKWGEIPVRFDRGPSTGKVITIARRRARGEEADRTDEKVLREVQLSTLAWTAGTDGPKRGPVVRMPENDAEFDAVKDQLRGAWVLSKPQPITGRTGVRGIGSSMNERAMARYAIQTGRSPEDLGVEERDRPDIEALITEQRRLIEAGVLGFISSSRDERVWTTSFRRWRSLEPGQEPRDIEVSIRLSDYDCINSRLTDGDEFVVEFDLKHTFTPGPIPVYNTVAEIRGSEKPDEYVIMSAHLDSWDGPGSQGTTDNGTGSAVMMEAARILMAVGAKPKRTIKFILWTGEEQGLLGAREWVREHEDLWPRISACFVDDGGTNYQGGLKCTDDMVPMLAAATAPVNGHFFDSKDGKPLNVNIQSTGDAFQQSGGSDHAAFVAKGIPGFFWDEVGRAEYGYGWHTQNDRLDLAIPEYLMQSATCSAITAYNLACADELLPRFDPEKNRPAERRPRGDRPDPATPPPPRESEGNQASPAPATGTAETGR